MKLQGAIAKKELKDLATVHFAAGHHMIPRVWIIIADKRLAKIYSKAGNSLEMIGEAAASEDGKSKMENKQMGRTTDSNGGPARIKYEPSMSPVRRRAFKFAHEIADLLDKALEKDAFDRLILVAPPQTLGDLRTALDKRVTSRVLAEINKDLTKLNEKDLRDGLEKIVWF